MRLGSTRSVSDDSNGTDLVPVPCPSVPGSAVACAGASSLALGPTVNFAIVDNPNHQFLIGLRWIPTFQGDLLRFATEFEIAFEWFTITLQAGLKQDSHAVDAIGTQVPRLGFWAVAGLGGRFRW